MTLRKQSDNSIDVSKGENLNDMFEMDGKNKKIEEDC